MENRAGSLVKHLFCVPPGKDVPSWKFWLNLIIVFALLTLVFTFAFLRLQYDFNWESVYRYRLKFINGFLMTLLISAFALVASFLLGVIFGIGQRSRFLPFRFLSKVYIEIIRGTPLLVQILVFFYIVADAFGIDSRYFMGVVILALFSGAYVSEIIRSGIESIGKSQLESARAIGLTNAQTYRYIIFPQVTKRILPPMAGQFVTLIKDSSLLSIISVSEFTLNAQEVTSFTYSTFESYIPLAVGYLLITFPISMFTKHLERKFAYET
ncbi:MAG: amino acid ABC transporter permease [Spirochaetales bacterium]|nr:amino acid ABC transporter permease [Spirochaetales bacterium]MCF7939843.1 amino acid ABC transporter permease [Spirochaetales bacterium]